ncbi:MAG: hypothetical protein K2P79_10030, partial [Sphingomonas sp.]|nr:hypothetical protein [Sphingomonas sp.]
MRVIGLSALLAATAICPAAARQAPVNDVVVTGQRLSETERALKACIARKCPVEEDIAATLRHAENLFVAGRYQQARN